MKRASRVAVVDTVVAPVTALYDVVLLAGSPRRLSLQLAPDLDAESVIEIAGERWMVADVRSTATGSIQLICIYAE